MPNQQPHDRGRDHTLRYLDILQDTLSIEFTDHGRPIFIPDRIRSDTLDKLKHGLRDLDASDLKAGAIEEMLEFNAVRPTRIQTTAVGYSEDFHLQVKLGLLLGERLILWDTVMRSILSVPNENIDLDALGMVTNNLLEMRPIIKDGALVLLPQPKTWLPRASHYYETMPPELLRNDTFKGCVNASALLDENIVLHPYLIQDNAEYNRTLRQMPKTCSSYYSDDKADYHYSLLRILKNRKLPFLDQLGATEFYNAITDMKLGMMRELQRTLSHKLSFPRIGMSPTEKQKWLDEIVAELEAIASGAGDYLDGRILDASFAGMSALKATFGVVADAGGAGALAVAVSGIGALGGIGAYLRKVFNKPKDPVLYQVFAKLSQAEREQTLKELEDDASIPGFPRRGHPSDRLG